MVHPLLNKCHPQFDKTSSSRHIPPAYSTSINNQRNGISAHIAAWVYCTNPENQKWLFPKVYSWLLFFSRSVVSDSLWPHGLKHAWLPCPLLSPGVCSNSYPLSQWCQPTISSSVAPFSSCPQSFPASGSFPMSQLFTSDGQSIGALASTLVLPMNIWGWISLGLTGLISLQSKGLL